jgi:hypothetical protein
LAKAQASQDHHDTVIEKIKNEVNTALKQKELLHKICFDLLDKNYDLYLKHEEMLEVEKGERSKLASNFQE